MIFEEFNTMFKMVVPPNKNIKGEDKKLRIKKLVFEKVKATGINLEVLTYCSDFEADFGNGVKLKFINICVNTGVKRE